MHLLPLLENRNKNITVAILLCSLLIHIPFYCLGHPFGGPGETHLKDFNDVFEDITGDNLKQLYKNISYDVMDKLPSYDVEALKGFSCGTGNHRWFGHWGFTDSIPFNLEPMKSCFERAKTNGKNIESIKKNIIDVWQKRVNDVIAICQELTGLPKKQAQAFVAIIYDTHLLGDYGGKEVSQLMSTDRLRKDLIKNIRALFANDDKFAEALIKEISEIRINANSSDSREILEVLKKSRLGNQLYANFSKTFEKKGIFVIPSKTVTTVNLVTNRYEKLLNKIPANIKKNVNAGLQTQIILNAFSTAINGYRLYNGSIDSEKLMRNLSQDAVLSANQIIADGIIVKKGNRLALQLLTKPSSSTLITSAGCPVKLGIATFVFDESLVLYDFVNKSIDEHEFLQKSGENVLKSAGSVACAYCSVALGFSPSGPVVMAMAVGGYLIVNQGISLYHEIDERNYITYKELFAMLPVNYKLEDNIETLYNSDNAEIVKDKRTFYDSEKRDYEIMGIENDQDNQFFFER